MFIYCQKNQNLKKIKIRYLETRLYVEKNAIKIKQRHIGWQFFNERKLVLGVLHVMLSNVSQPKNFSKQYDLAKAGLNDLILFNIV